MALKRQKVKMDLSTPSDNYIMFHHTGRKLIIPIDPDDINDSMGASYAENFPLSRSAPLYSYQHSGPRTVSVTFTLHRDLVNEYNIKNYKGDAVDEMITNLQGAVLPDYNSASKIVNPPLVSLQIRNEIYIKGVVAGNVGLSYGLPLLNYGTGGNDDYKYALVTVSFTISEVTPFSASILPKKGQFRN